ncbi:hypothetical protein DL96DRAFT_234617 [Flagelloscypha sp. PMI_526]|nr:hypothetical protein DL96DRAFT_234617 [Flagelloscypha sp. PMI_526]
MASDQILSRASTFSSLAVTSDSSTITFDHQQGVGRTVYGLMRSAGDRFEIFAGIISTWRRQGKPTTRSLDIPPLLGISTSVIDLTSFNVHVLKRSQLGFTRRDGFVHLDHDEVQNFTVRGDESYALFKARIAKSYGFESDSFRLLMLVKQRNRVTLLHPTCGACTLGDLAERNQSDSTVTRFYLQNIPQLPHPTINFPHVLLFLGQYDADKPWDEQQLISEFWQLYVPRSSTAEDITMILKRRINIQKDDEVNLYMVSEHGLYDMLPPRYRPVSGEKSFYDGDVFWYEVTSPPKKPAPEVPSSTTRRRFRSVTDLETVRPSGPRKHSGTLRIPVVITFVPKWDLECRVFRLVFDLKDTYDDIAEKVSDHLSLYPSLLTPRIMTSRPNSISLDWRDNLQIQEILNLPGVEGHNQTFEYEVLQDHEPWVQEIQRAIRQGDGMEEQQRPERNALEPKFMWPTKERMACARLALDHGEMLDILDAAGLSH